MLNSRDPAKNMQLAMTSSQTGDHFGPSKYRLFGNTRCPLKLRRKQPTAIAVIASEKKRATMETITPHSPQG